MEQEKINLPNEPTGTSRDLRMSGDGIAETNDSFHLKTPSGESPFKDAKESGPPMDAPVSAVTTTPPPSIELKLSSGESGQIFRVPEYYLGQGRKMDHMTMSPPPLAGSSCHHMKKSIGENQEELNLEVGTVFARDKKLWLKVDEAAAKRITNFTVKLLRKIIKLGLRGETSEWYELLLESSRRTETYTLPSGEFLNLQSSLEKEHPYFYVDSAAVQRASQFFRRHLSQLMESASDSLETRLIHLVPGWFRNEAEQWHYYSGLDEDCESTRSLVNLSQISPERAHGADIFAWNILNWGEIHVTLPVFLQSLSGFLYRFFKEAGCTIRYILDLCGPTGVGKTLLMKLLFRPFDPDRRMPNFTATERGIELFCEDNHDSLVPLDDLSSIQDSKAKALLEKLIRQYCDDNPRMVSRNGGRELYFPDLSFGLIISSETPLEGFRQSSQLRVLNIDVKENSLRDLSEIKRLLLPSRTSSGNQPNQDNLWDIFLTRFIRYLEPRASKIVEFISSYEAPDFTISYKRHDEVYRVLACIAEIAFDYFRVNLSSETSGTSFQSWMNVLQEIMMENESLGLESDPVEVFLDSLRQGVTLQETMPIAETKEQFATAPDKYLGFWKHNDSDELLILELARVFDQVTSQLSRAGISFPVTASELWRKILNCGISRGYQEKGRKSLRALYPISINGKKANMLVLVNKNLLK